MDYLPILLLILGLLIIVFDMMVAAFITPIGMAFAALGLLLALNIDFNVAFIISLIVAVVSYQLFARFIRKGTEDIGKPKYTFELKGKRGKVREIKGDEVWVELEGEVWLSKPLNEVKEGDEVVVVDTNGIKLIVKKLD
ncbi:MAG: NfeD family protein [Palaeococcus sp.]|uniref:NfeD family protein n=1 Tax=Palaeococcus sp. (in: euryarchaeotes) TaxID=2820298 RepID=UPI0025E3B93B|nr:NfeD family protein [Palaeococcus sp. (in: euryarchaeotes)]MCD6559298.1 NfeD family protein [Palaeococcus sp. (in: euryarchaeotes)]